MTQSFVVVPVPNVISENLVDHFMQHVLLKFGIYHLVILDDSSPFKGVFSATCKTLNINFDILSKINHKGLLVGKSHRFMNKSIMIAVEDRETNDVFLATSVVAEYVWNYSLIDGTDILCSFLTIGRELCFPLDIDLSALPPLVYNSAESVIPYLCLTNFNRFFVSKILENPCGGSLN